MSRCDSTPIGPNHEEGALAARSAPFVLAGLVVLLAVAGCPSGSSTDVDASSRPDATVVEVGLTFDDAASNPGDASASADASRPDAGAPLCGGACDPVAGTGCGRDACVLWAEAAACVPAAGTGARGATCARAGECSPGLACFRGPSGEGVCDRICCPAAPSCGPAAVCRGDGTLVDGTVTSWGRCLAPLPCALLDPTSCSEREACYVVGPAGETQCLVAGSSLEGETCALPNDCGAGLVCVGAFGRTCARLCDIAMPDACPTAATCVRQAYTPEGVGVCVTATTPAP